MNLARLQTVCYNNKMILADTPFDMYEQDLFGDVDDFTEDALLDIVLILAADGLHLINVEFDVAPCGQKATLKMILAKNYRVISYS